MSNPYGMQGPTALALQELQRVVGLSPSFPTVGGGLGGLPVRPVSIPKPPPPGAIGTAYQGGFYAGDISTTADSVATHHLVIAPVSTGQASRVWQDDRTEVPVKSVIDGPLNTSAMVADGNAVKYPAAYFCNDAVIGGFDDWYWPAQNELEVCYFNLKPTTTLNNTSSGINLNAVPARASDYTSGNPAQTSAAAFLTGVGAQAFTEVGYWSSTQALSRYYAQYISFGTGYRTQNSKGNSRLTRCIRRVAV